MDVRTIARVSVAAYRVPIERPVITSFGAMTSRPAVFVRLEDTDGAFGWGEIFANWPAAGAEHRARLVVEDFADLLLGAGFAGRTDLYRTLTEKTHIRALQCGEWGPFNSVVAGLDIAWHDLLARKQSIPLRRLLRAGANDAVPSYASGIYVSDAEELIAASRSQGIRTFKIKVGFDLDRDIAAVKDIQRRLLPGETLCADANQGWDVTDAVRFAGATDGLGWLEEPIRADLPEEDWRTVADAASAPLAGGENMAGRAEFSRAATSGIFGVLQPDIAKWGGFSGCFDVCAVIAANGRRYCPHYLGGGIGLAASAHLLAATGGDGALEIDVNPNPLREAFDLLATQPDRGTLHLGDAPGLGIETLPEEITRFRTFSRDISA